jgi:hypothetical protein
LNAVTNNAVMNTMVLSYDGKLCARASESLGLVGAFSRSIFLPLDKTHALPKASHPL